MAYTSENFFKATTASFTSCGKPEREADYVSASGSSYWYVDGGVIRESNHWGRGVASCDWMLDGGCYGYGMHQIRIVRENGKKRVEYTDGYDGAPEFENVCGFCEWTAFEAA